MLSKSIWMIPEIQVPDRYRVEWARSGGGQKNPAPNCKRDRSRSAPWPHRWQTAQVRSQAIGLCLQMWDTIAITGFQGQSNLCNFTCCSCYPYTLLHVCVCMYIHSSYKNKSANISFSQIQKNPFNNILGRWMEKWLSKQTVVIK